MIQQKVSSKYVTRSRLISSSSSSHSSYLQATFCTLTLFDFLALYQSNPEAFRNLDLSEGRRWCPGYRSAMISVSTKRRSNEVRVIEAERLRLPLELPGMDALSPPYSLRSCVVKARAAFRQRYPGSGYCYAPLSQFLP